MDPFPLPSLRASSVPPAGGLAGSASHHIGIDSVSLDRLTLAYAKPAVPTNKMAKIIICVVVLRRVRNYHWIRCLSPPLAPGHPVTLEPRGPPVCYGKYYGIKVRPLRYSPLSKSSWRSMYLSKRQSLRTKFSASKGKPALNQSGCCHNVGSGWLLSRPLVNNAHGKADDRS